LGFSPFRKPLAFSKVRRENFCQGSFSQAAAEPVWADSAVWGPFY
jgi:hypothetical protein